MRYPALTLAAAAALLTSCAVGPNYVRPNIAPPAAFRAPEPLPPAQAESFADLKWFDVFKDPQLQELIRTALQQNYDLRDAVARVEEARANLGIARSQQLPQVGGSGSLELTRLSRDGNLPLPTSFVHRKIVTGGRPASTYCPLNSTSGAASAAPPKPPAPTYSAPTRIASRSNYLSRRRRRRLLQLTPA